MPQNKGYKTGSETKSNSIRPALTPEARENQLVNLAMDLVEERLRNGTASSQETTHFLKLASTQARLEQAKLEKELKMIDAKTKQLASQANMEKLYTEAIAAMRTYSGNGSNEDDDNEY